LSRPGLPRDPRHRLGRDGETAAAHLLERSGLRVVKRGFRCRLGEIDLVVRDGEVLVFVEVKARRGLGYGRPAEAITPSKQRRLARVAQFFLARHGLGEVPCRFDVVEVLHRPGEGLRLRHIVDAFRPERC
jgi:putative endonuclease